MTNDKAIYTVLVGDYDEILDPDIVTPGWDYLVFTDNEHLRSNVWQPRKIEHLENLVSTTRRPKILPHKHLEDHYNLAVYIDGNIRVKRDLNAFIDVALPDNYDMATFQHPGWNCVYQEADAIIRVNRAPEDMVKRQIAQYAREGLPHNVGMICAYILVWRMHNVKLQEHCEHWFSELSDPNKIKRDQISFNYLLWKHNLIDVHLMDLNTIMGDYFHWLPHSKD